MRNNETKALQTRHYRVVVVGQVLWIAPDRESEELPVLFLLLFAVDSPDHVPTLLNLITLPAPQPNISFPSAIITKEGVIRGQIVVTEL